MNANLNITIMLFIMMLAMLVITVICLESLVKLVILNKRYTEEGIELRNLQESNKIKVIDYSKQVLDLIRMMVNQVAILKFRTFVDKNDMSKVTKSHIEKLSAEVAKIVKYSIDINNISLGSTIYTQEFFDMYIVDTSIFIVKQLFEKTIDEITE